MHGSCAVAVVEVGQGVWRPVTLSVPSAGTITHSSRSGSVTSAMRYSQPCNRRSRASRAAPGEMEPAVSDISLAEIRSWEKEGRLTYLGALPDVGPRLAGCRIYVLPSYAEGRPRSVLEALSTGRPVITCDSPGCRETIEDGVQGLLIPSKDASALASAILELLRNPERTETMAVEARRLAERVYDVRKVNAQMIEFMGL